ncbi:MAG: DegQ family serine endoprotease [Nitrospirales bacterium]|nr:DegQ family serine endoprotease [Nitrospirales bacterium]
MKGVNSTYATSGTRSAFSGILVSLALLLAFLVHGTAAAEITGKEASDILSRLGDAMAKVSEQVKPAVVNISTTRTVKTQRHPLFDDPAFRRFFGDGMAPQKRKATSLGSGIIASPDGYILTNNHVIDGADDILVKLSDNREFKGKVIGIDSKTDMAVIRIPEKNLPTITMGDSDTLKVGEMVIAVGNSFGLSHTITMGIISGLGRAGIGITDYEDFIQTDAAINPGNSGGALVNSRGELIGINTAIFSTSGGYQGIGFAIPVNMIRNVMESIISQGKVVRGWLGVQIQPLTAELAKQFQLKEESGVLLVDIVEGGPAEKGGLQRGDVVVEFDGRKITDPFHFKNMVAATKPGRAVPVKVVRNGKTETLAVSVGELPIEPKVISSAEFGNALRGVSVQDLTEEQLQTLNVQGKIRGVLVNNIGEDSPALGVLNKGDIILEVNRKPVASSKEYYAVASAVDKEQDVLLLIIRGGVKQYISLSAGGK